MGGKLYINEKIYAYLLDQMFEKEVQKEGKEKIGKFDRRKFRYNRNTKFAV